MPTLVYCDVDGSEHTFELGHTPAIIGRAIDCAIRSDDPRMSRQHARLTWTADGVWIEDLGSANGVYVGLERVHTAKVPVGEVVVVGSIVFQLAERGATLPPPVGVHATLAQWLSLERKARRVIEDERNAFAARVGSIHQQKVDGDVQAEALLARAQGEAGEAAAARAVAEDALVTTRRELTALRAEHEQAQRRHAAELERLHGELAGLRDADTLARTSAGLAEAAARAEADAQVAALVAELTHAQGRLASVDHVVAATAAAHDEALRAMLARLEEADRERTAAQLRAQSAERALAEARVPPEPKEETGSAMAPFKTIRMSVLTEEAPAEVAAAQAATLEATRRAEAAETTAAALSRDVTASMRVVADLEARMAKVNRELDAAVLRAVAAEQRAEAAARAAVDEIQAVRRASGEVPVTPEGEPMPTLIAGFEPEPTSVVRVDGAGRGRQVAEAELEIRDLERQVLQLRTELDAQLAAARAGARDLTGTSPTLAGDHAALLDALEESIDSLRSNLRAAGDELMALTSGATSADAQVAADAVTAADDELRRARQALGDLAAWLRADAD